MNFNRKKDLNELIELHGSGFSPSLVGFLLYGPFEKSIIKKSNLDLLLDRENIILEAYKQSIVPKIGLIVNSLTPENIKMPKERKKLNHLLVVRPFEYVRSKIAKEYKNQFELLPGTLSFLNSKRKLKENNDIKFAFLNNYLISYRFKKKESIKKKLNNLNFSILNDKNGDFSKKDLEDFLFKVIDAGYKYWDEYHYYERVYGKLNEFIFRDYFGFKIVDLNQERAEKRMNYLANLNGDFKIPGFNIIKSKFDDHRDRINFYRPGGIHYTLTDQGLINFPLEVQYQGIRSFILDKYGPNAHSLYTYRNKKAKYS